MGARSVAKVTPQQGSLTGAHVCVVEPVHVSGEQRLQMAQERARENQASLQKDLDARRSGADRADADASSVPNGCLDGYPGAASPGANRGSLGHAPSPELQDFVTKTFRKHFVMTLSELKRLLNLHVASMPAGLLAFHSMSDHMLQDAILLCHCKQIMVPVSITRIPAPSLLQPSRYCSFVVVSEESQQRMNVAPGER